MKGIKSSSAVCLLVIRVSDQLKTREINIVITATENNIGVKSLNL